MCQIPSDPLRALEERLAQLRAEAARLMQEIRTAEADVRNILRSGKEPPPEQEGPADR
jgi:hypothetical protein